MKFKFIILSICIGLFSGATFAQSVILTNKKVTYKRPKPQMESKRSFTINFPIVRAATPSLSAKITKAVNPLTVLKINLKEELNEYQWLEAADYEVNYNANGILCLDLFMEGSAAYPSSSTKTVVVDGRTGIVVRAASVFTNMPSLIARLNEMQEKEIATAIVEIKKDATNEEPNPEPLFEDATFTAANLEGFVVTEEGVTFKYNYGFPHAILALQPDGTFFFTWSQIKPFIKPGGLLSRITR